MTIQYVFQLHAMNIQINVNMERNVLTEDVSRILEHVQETEIVNLDRHVSTEDVQSNARTHHGNPPGNVA